MTPAEFLAFYETGIDTYSLRALDFDILVIYIPKSLAAFRTPTSISPDFNLHDALKLYATEKGIKLQLIEEKSINSYDPCKSDVGIIHKLICQSHRHSMAPGSNSERYSLHRHQLCFFGGKKNLYRLQSAFDSTGTGIRMVLRKSTVLYIAAEVIPICAKTMLAL